MRPVPPTSISANLVSLGYDDSKRTRWGAIGYDEILNVYNPAAGIDDHASVANLLQIGEIEDKQDIITGDIVRNCGVLILDGTQSWTCTNMGDFWRAKLSTDFLPRSGDGQIFCTHFIGTKSATAGHAYYSSGSLYLCDTDRQLCKTSANLNAFLAAQLAAGTPVIVVYPKITPTTESATPQPLSLAEGENEIGADCDYIDTIKLDCEYAATPGG